VDLLIVRHATAFERNPQRWVEDEGRPLSPAGIRRARKAAAGLKELVRPPERVWTSPLVRAKQTAAILTDIAGWPAATECVELSPGQTPQSVLSLLGRSRTKLAAVVGHQPGLGQLLATCLIGDAGLLAIELKKHTVACLSFNGIPRAGRATLKWLATPRMLRAIR
jgi:phosphohistidine phosphatase